ncbi:MAG: recombinase family protein [Anaerolineae bacterium]|nr:recombinase family protein [Anaerolineae bacterium]
MPAKKSTLPVSRTVALCYVRLSLSRDESDLDSPERQRANISAACEKHGWTPEWYEDTDGHRSGTNEKNRPGWLALKARLGDPDVAAVVANDLARLHRKGWRVGSLLDYLEEHRVGLVLAAPGRDFDFTGPQGRMMIMLIAMMDEWYAMDTSQRQKDSVRYRRSRGIAVGRIPFGTVRGESGYIEPSPYGVWLLPDGTVVEGDREHCPAQEAVFRGYFEAAEQIMRLFAENRYGRRKIAAKMNEAGYWFRDVKGKARQFDDEGVRAVTANWHTYGGVPLPGKATGRSAKTMLPENIALNPERAVMDIELCYRVGQVRIERYREKPHAAPIHAFVYPLVGIVYCAHCASIGQRTKLQGYEAYRALPRYRHGDRRHKCAAQNRSVKAEILDNEFARLLQALVVKPEAAAQMAEVFNNAHQPQNSEQRRAEILAEINLCKQRMKNAEVLFLKARIDQRELDHHLEENENEIARLQVELSEGTQIQEMISLSITMLAEMGNKWAQSSQEDKQAFAQSLFSEVVFDLDTHRITRFTLKPWAEPFLQVHVSSQSCLEGFEPPASCSVGKRSSTFAWFVPLL